VDFLRDYVGIFPAVIAVINGVLAVFSTPIIPSGPGPETALHCDCRSSQLLGDRRDVLFPTSRHCPARSELTHRTMIRDQLGVFIGQGTSLLNVAGSASSPVPVEAANAWAESVETFSRRKTGQLICS